MPSVAAQSSDGWYDVKLMGYIPDQTVDPFCLEVIMDSEQTPSSPQPQPVPQVVHIRSRPGGLWTALGLVVGLCVFGFIFVLGIALGIIGTIASSSAETVILEQTYRDGRQGKIMILPIQGIIDDRQARFARAAVDHILDDRAVSGVVLRVNSPGGGVTASDEIWYEVNRLRQRNVPVVASYGGLAASGGYYISCATDYIIAQETSITGSIGVIAQIFTMEGLMDKVGIEPVTLVATGSPEKAVGNYIFRQWDEHDQQRILTMLDAAYDIFNRRVRDGRGHVITEDTTFDRMADGSIYTAQQALEGGLIDGIGYLDDAIAHIEQMASLTAGRAEVVRLSEPPRLFGGMMRGSAATQRPDLFDADAIRGLVNDFSAPRVMFLMK